MSTLKYLEKRNIEFKNDFNLLPVFFIKDYALGELMVFPYDYSYGEMIDVPFYVSKKSLSIKLNTSIINLLNFQERLV